VSGWTHRVGPAPVPRELESLRDAAQDLADQARPGPVFAKVTSVAILTTAVLSGVLAAVHLWKALFPRHQEQHHRPEPRHRAAQPPAHEHGHAR
jgi:hypothetical protein